MASYVAGKGEFNRDTNYITTRITADGRDGYPVEPGRYTRADMNDGRVERHV